MDVLTSEPTSDIYIYTYIYISIYLSNIFLVFIPNFCSKLPELRCQLRCQIQFIQDGPAVGWAVKGPPLDGLPRLVRLGENDRCDVFGKLEKSSISLDISII